MSHHDFSYPSAYISVNGYRMHYIQQGPREGPPVVMLHGNCTWGYAYRNFIPHLAGAGYNVIVPDHIGFGHSDKPAEVETYTFAFHTSNLEGFINGLELKNIVLVGQDWGGLMALDYVIRHRDNLWALVLMNSGPFLTTRVPLWSRLVRRSALGDLLIRRMNLYLRGGSPEKRVYYKENLDKAVMTRYRAPFPNYASRSGILAFYRMVPTDRGHPSWGTIKAIQDKLYEITAPVLLIGAKGDPTFGIPEAKALQARLPHTELRILDDGGHLLQEDRPDLLSRWIIDFLQRAKEVG